jgi:hypothetical protein
MTDPMNSPEVQIDLVLHGIGSAADFLKRAVSDHPSLLRLRISTMQNLADEILELVDALSVREAAE